MPILYKYIGKKVAYLHVPFKHVACFPSPLFKSPIQNPILIWKRSSPLLSYTQAVGLLSLSVMHEDIDHLCFVFLCFGSFCVTCSAFKFSPGLKYIQQQRLVVFQQLPFYSFDQYRSQTALQSRYQLRLISPPGNLFIIVLSFMPQWFGSFCCTSLHIFMLHSSLQ